VEERATLKILPFQPSADQHRAESVYRVLLENLDALYSTAKRLTGRADLAEDLVQETAQKALEAIPALKDERNTRAWLFRILLNGIRDQARRNKLWVEVGADEETPDLSVISEGGISESVRGARAEDVRRALSSLPPETRSLAILIDIEEFTIAEAAAMLQIPPGTAASRLSRARRQLRELLEAYRSRSSRREGRS
jgi:RNA polymerase sigma-70 factor (ECF subfamily)